jgi:hypothetical protein
VRLLFKDRCERREGGNGVESCSATLGFTVKGFVHGNINAISRIIAKLMNGPRRLAASAT